VLFASVWGMGIGVHNRLPGSCSGNSIGIRVVFGFKISTRLIIGVRFVLNLIVQSGRSG
jgi:hypothetical protein